MSGGSYDYAYRRIRDAADELKGVYSDPRRAAFQKLLYLVADAMYAIEWVDSGDTSPGDEHEAIDNVISARKVDAEILRKAAAYDRVVSYFQVAGKDRG